MPHLELINLLLAIPQVLQNPRQLPLIRRTLLRPTNRFIQPWRPTNKNLHILLLRLRQDSLQQVLRNKPLPACPALRRLVEEIESAEALGVGVFKIFQFAFQEYVGFGDVAEDEGDVCFVGRVFEDGAGELVHPMHP